MFDCVKAFSHLFTARIFNRCCIRNSQILLLGPKQYLSMCCNFSYIWRKIPSNLYGNSLRFFLMENSRILLAALAAFTLVFSVISGVSPSYFSGLSAYAENHDDNEE